MESLRAERELREKRQAELERECNQARHRTAEVDDDASKRPAKPQRACGKSATAMKIERARNDAEREHLRAARA